MRVSILLLFLLFLLSRVFAGANEEFRAVWVITWEHISAYSTPEENKARVRQILDNVKKANMNAVLWQVRQSGTAYYNSSYEPWGYYAGYSYPGYDPLAYAVQEAHKRGLELHAWFNCFSASDIVNGAPAQVHPEWVCRDGYGVPMPASRALSPGLQDVRDYTINVAMEIVHNYDIDGLHLDYVRWNEYDRSDFTGLTVESIEDKFAPDGIFSEQKMENLALVPNQERYLYDVQNPYDPVTAPGGFATWEDWWRWSVTEFVKTLHDSIQQVKPWVRLSPAALGKYRWSSWQGYGIVFQDAALWFNQGFVDQLTPMHYHWTTGDQFYGMLVADGQESWGYWIQAGVDSGRLFTVGPGSYRLDELNVWDNHTQIVQRSRDVPWVDGFQFFSYGSWRNHDYWEEAKDLFFQRLTKVRAATFLNNQSPSAPLITVTKINDLRYDIEVSPNEPLAEDQRFAIYRSEDDNPDVASDELIDIHFGQDVYTYTDTMSGLQNFNGRYTYYATRFDRYWNESVISNTYLSDSIPSFAPVVLWTDPLPGDTIPVFIPIVIDFSKTMDTATFQGNLTFEPAVPAFSRYWNSDQKQLVIIPHEDLFHDTLYALTIHKEVTDINGKQLDGESNGGGSEDYVLQFFTSALDIFPPRLVYSNPSVKAYVDDFDVDNVISFGFDEMLDPASLQVASTAVTTAGQPVAHKAMIYNMNDRAVLGVQTEDPLYSGHPFRVSVFTDITDTSGNPLDSAIVVDFETEPYAYELKTLIDNFSGSGNWQDPGYSGSTNGVNTTLSTFGIVSDVYLPAAYTPVEKKSARLSYVWDPDLLAIGNPNYLLREFLDESLPRNVFFNTDYILQCYVFGDGSLNKFRFALDEGNGTLWPNHEVSVWFTIDWMGWKLIQWDLSDPDMVGNWIGNGTLDMSTYRIDSFQLTHDSTGAMSGTLYFKDLRVVKKKYEITVITDNHNAGLPQQFALQQNYPNPFNPVTTIPFDISRSGPVQLKIYNVLGQEVVSLVNKVMQPGSYKIQFNATNLASGVYIYELRAGDVVLHKRMILLK